LRNGIAELEAGQGEGGGSMSALHGMIDLVVGPRLLCCYHHRVWMQVRRPNPMASILRSVGAPADLVEAKLGEGTVERHGLYWPRPQFALDDLPVGCGFTVADVVPGSITVADVSRLAVKESEEHSIEVHEGRAVVWTKSDGLLFVAGITRSRSKAQRYVLTGDLSGVPFG
jgi:hypothetical protein